MNTNPGALDDWPATIETESALEEVLTRPSPRLVESIRAWASPLVILGAGGKRGRPGGAGAAGGGCGGHALDVVAVSRFTMRTRGRGDRGVRTVACDLLGRTPGRFGRC
jgi:hypothetical protein